MKLLGKERDQSEQAHCDLQQGILSIVTITDIITTLAETCNRRDITQGDVFVLLVFFFFYIWRRKFKLVGDS